MIHIDLVGDFTLTELAKIVVNRYVVVTNDGRFNVKHTNTTGFFTVADIISLYVRHIILFNQNQSKIIENSDALKVLTIDAFVIKPHNVDKLSRREKTLVGFNYNEDANIITFEFKDISDNLSDNSTDKSIDDSKEQHVRDHPLKFSELRPVRGKFASFMGVDDGTVFTGPVITKKVWDIIQSRNLTYNKDKRVFRADEEISDIFDIPMSVNDSTSHTDRDGFNFCNLQKYIGHALRKW